MLLLVIELINIMDLIQALKNLGLNEKEAKVYLSLLQIGKATAYAVTKHCGLKKPTTYVVLDNLIEKGLVNRVPRAKIMHYIAISPEDFFSIAESRIINARTALPELKALSRGGEYKVNVAYYEGLGGIKEMYNKILKTMGNKEVVGFYAHAKHAPSGLTDYWEEWTEERLKKNIKVRGITPKDTSTQKWIKNQTRYLLDLKALPLEKYDSDVSIEVYENFTQIVSSKYLQGILIENPDVAKAIKQIFELAWEKEK